MDGRHHLLKIKEFSLIPFLYIWVLLQFISAICNVISTISKMIIWISLYILLVRCPVSSYHNCFILLIRAICLVLQLSASEQFESRILAVSMRYGHHCLYSSFCHTKYYFSVLSHHLVYPWCIIHCRWSLSVPLFPHSTAHCFA